MKKLTLNVLIFWVVVTPLLIVFWIMQPLVGQKNLGKIPKVDPRVLQNDVEELSTTFAQRNFWALNTLNEAASYIQHAFLDTTKAVHLQAYQVEGETFSNVIAEYGPQQGRPIIIGAHYDAYELTAGADDNASGVAGLLALAKLLKENPPKVPVKLVAYTLEEPPNFRTEAMGSRQHALKLVADGVRPQLVVVLEMIGYFSDADNSQQYPVKQLAWLYPSKGDFIAIVGNLSGASETRLVKSAMQSAADLPVVSINAPSLLPGVDFSDHASYWQHDMPAIMVTDTSFYRNPHYHKPSDTPATLDYTRMAKVVQGVYGVIKSVDHSTK